MSSKDVKAGLLLVFMIAVPFIGATFVFLPSPPVLRRSEGQDRGAQATVAEEGGG